MKSHNNEIQLFEKLLKEWYSKEEAEKILNGYQQMKERKWVSLEKAYIHLLAKEKVYA